MISIVIIGSGNLANHLIEAFSISKTVEIKQVFARNSEKIISDFEESKITSNYADLLEANLYILAVSDNSIAEVSTNLPFENRLVVHTSGSVSIENLNSKNRKGIFYPLQTFTKNKKVNFAEIPICLETETEVDFTILEIVAKSISNAVYKMNSDQRKALHVSAVFVNNFVNHLYQIGNEICRENKINFDFLKPLIAETAQKINTISPQNAQTGPAKRNDFETIEKHLDFLKNENFLNIYKSITQSIQFNEKL